jgi:hypothetical protein
MNSLNKLLKKWQRLLKLKSWDITVELKEDKEYEEFEVAAGCKRGTSSGLNLVCSDRKDSDIFVKKSCTNLELYLVHELVHILINPLDGASAFMLEYIPSADVRAILSIKLTDALEETNWNVAKALINTFAKSE